MSFGFFGFSFVKMLVSGFVFVFVFVWVSVGLCFLLIGLIRFWAMFVVFSCFHGILPP